MNFTKEIRNIFFLLDKKHKIQLSIVYFIFLINIFLDLVGIGMIVPIINVIIGKDVGFINEILPIDLVLSNISQQKLLFYAITFFLIFYIFKTLFSTFAIWYQKRFIFITSKEFSEKLLKKYFNIKYLDFLNKNQSDLIRNIVFESSIFITSIVHSLIDLCIEILLLIGIGCLLIFYDPLSASILIFIIIILGLGYIIFFRKKLKVLGTERQNLISNILKILSEGFILQKEVRILQKEDFIFKKFSEDAKKIANINIFEQIINTMPKIWFELIAVLGLSGIVFYFIIFNIDLEFLIPLLALYAAAIFRLLPCANRIIGALNSISHNLPAFNVIFDELIISKKISDREVVDKTNNNKLDQYIFDNFDPKKLHLNNLSFSYKKDQNNFIFRNLSLTFNKGQVTGLIGKSGSGKSTIANIISGLIDEYDGKIEINDNSDFNKNILRRSVGYVPQITNLLDDSILKNICFGVLDEKIDYLKLDKILKEVELNEVIKNLDKGISTIVGDQGLTLSGGQRQKIALARTLYLDPKIIIFDESTNSLDKKTEKQFFKNIISLKKNKIIICITHDLGLSEYFDQIYDLSKLNENK